MVCEQQERHIQRLLESVSFEPDYNEENAEEEGEAEDECDPDEEEDCAEERQEDSASEQSLDSDDEDDRVQNQNLISKLSYLPEPRMTSPKGLIPPSQIPSSQNTFDGPSCRNKRRIEKTTVDLHLHDLQQPD